jgi:hypothetical protein
MAQSLPAVFENRQDCLVAMVVSFLASSLLYLNNHSVINQPSPVSTLNLNQLPQACCRPCLHLKIFA